MNNTNNQQIPKLEIYKIDRDTALKFSDLITGSGIKQFSPKVEVWTSSQSNKALAYLSHGIFRYFGKFPPTIARHLITKFTREGDLVIDPMCGSGTTALEALLLKRKSLCIDVNPLSVLISKVKTTKLDEEKYNYYLRQVIAVITTKKKVPLCEIIGLKNPNHWFLPETIHSLSRIKHAINYIDPPLDIKDAFNLALLSIVRRVSRATTQQGRLFLDITTAETDALPFFEKKAREIIKSLSKIPLNKKNIRIYQQSILEKNKSALSKLIICHPPYFNSYKYSGVNSLELAWLGIDHAVIRKNEVRESFKVGKPEKLSAYLDDMENVLRNLSDNLDKNGVLALMIGDTVMRGKYIPVTKNLVIRLKDVYKVEYSALRIPKFTEASWAASQRRNGKQVGINLCDLVVIFKKNEN